MSNLRLFLLGSPRIELENAPLEINRRKAIALLAYLAMTNETHSRETLATMFWPDNDQSQAFSNLRVTLWTLNKTLGKEWLDTEHETVSIAEGVSLWLDVQHFRMLAQKEQTLPDAAALSRDDFMFGFNLKGCSEFEDWQFFEREALRREYAQLLEKLVEHHIATNELDEALTYARNWLALDPLQETAHRHLMTLYYWTDQHAAALRQYKECERLLWDELEIEPEAETIERFHAIQSRRLQMPVSPKAKAVSSNLPVPATPFIGRTDELQEIETLLNNPSCRLVTLVGAGGMGKTRLSIEVASALSPRYVDGVYFIPLAPVSSADFMVPAFADTLHFAAYREGDPKDQLLAYLREKNLLMVADNFEHLLNGANLIAEILSVAPQVKVLATSRERLALQEEWLYELQGLSHPPVNTLDETEQYGAIQLFMESAQRIRTDFTLTAEDKPHVIRICQLVEGMPLAIELAASWLQILNCREIADEIEQSLDFLSADVRNLPTRHRSIRAMFNSSWERLLPNEQLVLSKLSVFRGGFNRHAAQIVAGASLHLLLSLVSKSLLHHRQEASRFEMHELLRQFAAEKLTTGDETYRQHSAYYTSFLKQRENHLKGDQQIVALQDIDTELDNIRAAWQWATAQPEIPFVRDAIPGLLLFYGMRSRLQEREQLFKYAVDHLKQHALADEDKGVLAQVIIMQATTLSFNNQPSLSKQLQIEARNLLLATPSFEDAATFGILASLDTWPAGDLAEAKYWITRSLDIARRNDDWWNIGHSTRLLGHFFHHQADYTESEHLYRQSLEICRNLNDRWGQSLALAGLGQVAYTLGLYADAEALYREAIELSQAIGDVSSVDWMQTQVGMLLFIQGQYEAAEALLRNLLQYARHRGEVDGIAWRSLHLSEILTALNRDEEASEAVEECLSLTDENLPWNEYPWATYQKSRLLLRAGRAQQSYDLASKVFSILNKHDIDHPWSKSATLFNMGESATMMGDYETAHTHLVESLAIATEVHSVMLQLRHLVGVARLFAYTNHLAEALEIIAFVQHHPASWQETKDRAKSLLQELDCQLTPEIITTATNQSLSAMVAKINVL